MSFKIQTTFKFILIALLLVVLCFSLTYKQILKYLYPIDYHETVKHYCSIYDLDEVYVFAVIEVESSFNPNAVSSVGAKGLMQITESTFNWLNTMETIKGSYIFNDMFNPEISIKFGTYLLKMYFDEFTDETAVFSAYHAGYGKTKEWLNNESYSQNGVIKKIPYKDTASYVKKVQKTIKIYNNLYGGIYE